MKEGIFIKSISKREAEFLREAGYSKYVHSGHNTYHNLQVVENPTVLSVLEKHNKSITVETVK